MIWPPLRSFNGEGLARRFLEEEGVVYIPVMDFRANGSQAFKETTKAIDIEMEGAVLRDHTGARTSNPHSLERKHF
jgi:hypothetical protein